MKKWSRQVKIKGQIYDVVEHTDKECEKPRTDGQVLAPFSHGFVCLYQGGQYKLWCGSAYAEKHLI